MKVAGTIVKDGFEYSDEFNGRCYLDRYIDVALDGKYNTPEKALIHWETFGKWEGRIPGCLIGPAKDPGNGGIVPPPPAGGVVPGVSNKVLLIGGVALVIVLFGDKIKKALKL
jgi:hypothetical protein